MFCRKCGQEITGSEKFCPKCGAPVVNTQQPGIQNLENRTNTGTASKERPPYFAIGLIVLIAVVVVLLVKSLFFSGNYETPVKNLVKSIETQDAKLLMSVFPDEAFDVIEEETGMNRKALEASLESIVFDEFKEEYDGKIKIEYEIDETHTLKNSEIREIEDELENIIKIKDGKNIELFMEIYVDGEVVHEEDESINVIKVGRKWYLDPSSF